MRVALALLLLVVSACSTVAPTPAPTLAPTLAPTSAPASAPNATIGPSAAPETSVGPSPSVEPWRVDVVNGPRRVIVSVSPGGLYFVEPNAMVTLFETPHAQAGGIEVIEVTESGCVLLDKTTFRAESFTIKLIGGLKGPYMVTLESGAGLTGPPTAERTIRAWANGCASVARAMGLRRHRILKPGVTRQDLERQPC